MSIYVIIAIIVVILLIALFAFKASSENKAKKIYTPPMPAKKTALPQIDEIKLPAKSESRLRFCKHCGSANSDQDLVCSNCGKKL